MAVALLFAVIGLGSTLKQRQSQGWPTTPGTVTYSSVDKHSDGRRKPGRKRTPTFTPSVHYSYTVSGVKYDGYRITLIGSPTDLNSARAHAGKYPVGANIQVHYNPANPSESILEPQDQGGSLTMLGMGLLFVVIGIGGGIIWLRKR